MYYDYESRRHQHLDIKTFSDIKKSYILYKCKECRRIIFNNFIVAETFCFSICFLYTNELNLENFTFITIFPTMICCAILKIFLILHSYNQSNPRDT